MRATRRLVYFVDNKRMGNDQLTTKDHILDCGERLIASKGFVGVGLSEILTVANVPKGSFYHYFSSKERFGEELLKRYLDDYLQRLDILLTTGDTSARERLMGYWSYWNTTQCGIADSTCPEPQTGSKCLIVKLSAEVADISEAMRLALRDGTEQVVQRIADCIEEGRADGSLPNGKPALDVARVLYQMWLGAALLSKLSQDRLPLQQAREATEHLLLCGNAVALSTSTH